jgi:hypothetical protein
MCAIPAYVFGKLLSRDQSPGTPDMPIQIRSSFPVRLNLVCSIGSGLAANRSNERVGDQADLVGSIPFQSHETQLYSTSPYVSHEGPGAGRIYAVFLPYWKDPAAPCWISFPSPLSMVDRAKGISTARSWKNRRLAGRDAKAPGQAKCTNCQRIDGTTQARNLVRYQRS